jgi:hypothetical protein
MRRSGRERGKSTKDGAVGTSPRHFPIVQSMACAAIVQSRAESSSTPAFTLPQASFAGLPDGVRAGLMRLVSDNRVRVAKMLEKEAVSTRV